jgi:hypothetical protein
MGAGEDGDRGARGEEMNKMDTTLDMYRDMPTRISRIIAVRD